MTDPDTPSRTDPMFGECQHWVVINIPGADVSKGQTMVEYMGSGPPKGTGFHRYIFVVYKQPDIINTNESCGIAVEVVNEVVLVVAGL